MTNSDTPVQPEISELRQQLSGLEFFRRMMAGTLPPPPLVALLGMRLVEVDEGRVVFAAEPREAFYNGLGITHGGFAATMLDSALGCAINTMMPAGRVMTTLELKVNFTRALRREVGEIRCEAKVVHVGKRTGTSEGRIVDANGRIYAHGTTTCIVVERTGSQGSQGSHGSRGSMGSPGSQGSMGSQTSQSSQFIEPTEPTEP